MGRLTTKDKFILAKLEWLLKETRKLRENNNKFSLDIIEQVLNDLINSIKYNLIS